jgi:cobalt-zinc-cadmium efflux system protein
MTTTHQKHGHQEHKTHDGHDHTGHHGHHHELPKDMGTAFLIGIALNVALVAGEWYFGVTSNSLALLADATHNLGDVLGLVMAWGATVLARRPPTERFTYGLRGTSILSALANATLLVLVTGALGWEAVQRFQHPQPVAGTTVIVVALVGVFINGLTAWLFRSGQKADLNVRGAYLHMAVDAATSLGVAATGLVILYTGWHWLDPAVTLALAVVILIGTWGLMRDSLKLALQAVPESVELVKVREYLAALPGVSEVHDLHVWGMSTTENAMTAHLVCPAGHPGDLFLQTISDEIEHKFLIHHVTLQVELANGAACSVCSCTSGVSGLTASRRG